MLSVLNLIWAVYVGSWSLEKDGAFLCLYSVSFSIVLLLSKKWITIIVLIDHHVISYLISILIFLEIFLITLSFNINDMQPDIIIFLLSALKDFYFTWEFDQVRDLKKWLITIISKRDSPFLPWYIEASVKHKNLRYWKCCTPQ